MPDLKALLTDQENALAVVTRAVDVALQKVATVDPNLKPEIVADRVAEVRREAVDSLNEVRREMARRADEAEALARHHTPQAERRKARFNADPALNASMTIATFARLARVPTAELIEHLADAVDAHDLATAEAVRLEFYNRSDAASIRETFESIFKRIPTVGADDAAKAVSRVKGLQGLADEKLSALARGVGDPVARLAAARMVQR